MTAPRFHVSLVVLTVAFFAVALYAACQQTDTEEEPSPADTTAVDTAVSAAPAEAGVMEIAAVDYAFRIPESVPSGWTTIRLANEGEEEHLAVLWKMPGDRGVDDYVEGVVEPFVMAYDSLMAGVVDEQGMWRIFAENAAPWSAEVRAMGGPGFIAPGRTADTTVKLEPGRYVMECYVKTPEGEWHTELGMLAEFVVTDDSTGMSEPDADMELTLSNDAIATEGTLTAGGTTIAVHYAEHPEAGLGNDVHLARLEEDGSIEEIVRWTDWRRAEGLRAPAPALFLGGAQEMPVGYTSYFTVELEPGRYVLLSEATTVDGLVEEFTVE